MDSSDRADKTAQIQRGRPFERGKSGYPKGRPKGARSTATVLAESLLDGEAEALTRKLIDMAKDGDSAALRLCIERSYLQDAGASSHSNYPPRSRLLLTQSLPRRWC
jgi:Family of unknown function (DUF5681)